MQPFVYETVPPEVDELNKFAEDLSNRRLFSSAVVAVERAISICPTSPSLWGNLAAHLWSARQYDKAETAARRAIEIDPQYLYGWGNLGLVLQCKGQIEEAEACFNTVLVHDPDHHRTRWDRGLLRLSVGNYEEGFEDYEARMPYRGTEVYRNWPFPMWDGEESLLSKNVYINAEQGIGDCILMARFLPWISELIGPYGKLYICYHDIVSRLLWCVHDLRNVEFIPEGVPLPSLIHAGLNMASLPHRFQCTTGNLPDDPGFIKSRVAIQAQNRKVVVPYPDSSRKPFRIGICWSGNPNQDRNQDRRVPLELLSQLLSLPDVYLYSLQCGGAERDIEGLGLEDWIIDPSAELVREGLAGTGTAMQQLDLVITCCTSIAHMAGALGLPAWVMIPEDPYWVWGRGDYTNSIWWPSLRLFRQEKPFEWQLVIDQVKDALAIKMHEE